MDRVVNYIINFNTINFMIRVKNKLIQSYKTIFEVHIITNLIVDIIIGIAATLAMFKLCSLIINILLMF